MQSVQPSSVFAETENKETCMAAWRLWRLRIFPRTGTPRVDAERHEDEVTLQAFVFSILFSIVACLRTTAH